MADPVQRRGEWWQQQPDGSWLRWDEANAQWQPQEFPPPPPDTAPPAASQPLSGYSSAATYASTSQVGSSTATEQGPAPTPGYKYARAEDGTWWARNERSGELHWHDASAGVWRKHSASGQTPVAGPSADYAGFWMRVGAFVIDAIIVFAAAFAIGFVVALLAGGSTLETATAEEATAIDVLAQLVAVIAQWIYFAAMESSSKQATLGKMMMGLRVTDMDGNRVGFGKATGRYFGKILSGLILGIGYLMVAWTQKKQGLHDQMAGTLVLKGRAT